MSENITISRPYAKAIFHVASNKNLLDEWDNVLSSLSKFIDDKSFNKFLCNRFIQEDVKVDVIIQLLKSFGLYTDILNKEIDNFVKVLSIHGRLSCIKDIYFLYKSYMNAKLGCLEAVISVAYSLNSNQKEQIVTYLSKRFNKQILASFIVDDRLLGGFLVRIGDFVLDASVYGNLVSLRIKIMA